MMKNIKAKREEIDLGDLIAATSTSGADPITYQYFKGLKERRIILNGQIDDSLLEYVILPLEEMDQDGTGKPITIELSSAGGSLYSGMALIATLEKTTTPITIRVRGYACSMAFLICLVHFNKENIKTVASFGDVFLMHSGSTELGGSLTQVLDTAAFNKKYEQIIKQYVLDHSKMTSKYYNSVYTKEYWMTADEALKYGVISEII